MNSPCLCTDATGVLVLDKERCRTGHFWVLLAPGRHVLYRYSPCHDRAAVDKLLGDCCQLGVTRLLQRQATCSRTYLDVQTGVRVVRRARGRKKGAVAAGV